MEKKEPNQFARHLMDRKNKKTFCKQRGKRYKKGLIWKKGREFGYAHIFRLMGMESL